jgi:hypothetical protein
MSESDEVKVSLRLQALDAEAALLFKEDDFNKHLFP